MGIRPIARPITRAMPIALPAFAAIWRHLAHEPSIFSSWTI
jgi:hypothetical protein